MNYIPDPFILSKFKEVLHSGSVHCLDVWKNHGIIGEQWPDVWRVEGQFRRTILKEFSIDTLEDLYARLADLWGYLTEWASLRTLDDDNSARRSLHPIWEVVTSAGKFLGDPAGVTRCVQADSTAPVEWYVRHITGCLVPFASRLKVVRSPRRVPSPICGNAWSAGCCRTTPMGRILRRRGQMQGRREEAYSQIFRRLRTKQVTLLRRKMIPFEFETVP